MKNRRFRFANLRLTPSRYGSARMSGWLLGAAGLFLLLGVSLQRPLVASAEPPAQDEATPTGEEFIVVPIDGEEGVEDAVPITVVQSTATPDADFVQELPEGWQLPVNLSRSGAASEPQMVVDSGDAFHVLWRDAIDGFVYVTGKGDRWSDPAAPELPFATRRYFPDLDLSREMPLFTPVLAADDSGGIHAFWINDFEGSNTLYHSSVRGVDFADFNSWSLREPLDSSASSVSWALDNDGELHLAYIRPAESNTNPSGVYYRRLDGDGGWSDPVLLYESRYFRGVDAGDTNVQIMADDGDLFIVWDDTGREQVYFARSTNGGRDWEAPQEIDRRSREDDEGALGPGQITVGSDGEAVILSWSSGHEPGIRCAQYVAVSRDRGQTWSLREHLDSLPSCLIWPKFVSNDQGMFLLGTTEREAAQRDEFVQTAYLLAWDGSRWSDPQVQEPLTRFTNPDTFQPVQLFCLQGLGTGTQVQFLGCDEGNGEDIWLVAREVSATEDWFPPPSVWVGPENAGSSQVDVADLLMVVDGIGGSHAFWYDGLRSEIYYAGWNGQTWSAGRPVIRSPNGAAEQLAAAAAGDRLYVVWRDSATGLHFSRAAADRTSEWSVPQLVIEEGTAASSPSMVVAGDGRLLVAYAVPLNEERGIYLVESDDGGDSWSEPRRVFDGTAAGWDMVDLPRLAETGDGQLHMIWTRRALPPNGAPLALAYSRSGDGGETWTEPAIVTEGPVVWSRLLGVNAYIVHRLWAVENDERLALWHDVSQDGGLTWSSAAQVAGLSGETEPAVSVDAGNSPHLLALEGGRILDIMWRDERWESREELDVPFSPGGALAAAGDQQIQLLALYSGQSAGADEDEVESDDLYFMWRPFDVPPALVASQPTLTPTAAPTATPEVEETPQPTPTIVFDTERDTGLVDAVPGLPGGLDASAGVTALAIVPAALIVLLVILVGVRARRRR